jgi:RND superfamily putative drug exporter
MVEARESGMSTPDAIRTGLLRTGRMISSAALLLIVVTGAFGLSQLQTMRFLGVGMIVALLLDATVVRMLLVPAILRLLGNAAWWAPAPLRRLQRRIGLAEPAAAPAEDRRALETIR